MKGFLIAAACLALAAGCAPNTNFIYKPSEPATGVRKIPLKIAVLPFQDGTENFTRRGSFIDEKRPLAYNLAKAGWGSVISAVPPELWAKALADEMAASGRFESVLFLYDRAELGDETLRIEGTLRKATYYPLLPNEFTIALRASRNSDDRLVWEKEVSRVWKTPNDINEGCGLGLQCMSDRHRADVNRVMRDMLSEAGVDLARALVPLVTGGTGVGSPQEGAPTTKPGTESADGTIENILKGP